MSRLIFNYLLDKQEALLFNKGMMNCPHCGKRIPDSLITARSGQIGGKKTAKRGPEYFRKIASMRRTHAGGRPKNEK
jgi:hypothetical protein